MDILSKVSIQQKMVLPWMLPLAGLAYGYVTISPGVAENLLLIVGLLCLAGGIVSWLIGQRILTTLENAKRSIHGTANADFSYSPPIQGKDELAHLSYSLGNLTNSVRTLISKASADLEKQSATKEIDSGEE
jgi:methyl-accepting chemotaxis protein